MREVILGPGILALVERCIIDAHGDTVENLLEKAEQKIQQEREKSRLEREKNRLEREKSVMKLHRNLGLEAKTIANILSLEESIVVAILEKE